ncbi:MAG: hypothetical protein AAF513_09050 [Pseudomonadota bacterium]
MKTSKPRPFQPREFDRPVRIGTQALLGLMHQADHVRAWTPRQIARKLRLPYGPTEQRRLRRVLHTLWLEGQLCRSHAEAKTRQIYYGLPAACLDPASTQPSFEMACRSCSSGLPLEHPVRDLICDRCSA